ncbi:ABC transporter ATP-binding protein [Tessaracoccus oleiagri]|uniref:ABC-type multidrug transport system, ATPase and permease component n=1 Tax=Tessaracoccus oleiagri TaxID=686624 RepID=A0A1G9KP88_9ACTN|nr:ABC transporter ATP-binding protein [Tessaracoccus oleiagri]SDL51598.1 ABC-type multidrug transport system, ATPase and permease component [Tessaracoccus oleiagri]
MSDTAESWRGKRQEIAEEQDTTVALRPASRKLLVELVRPYKWMGLGLVVAVVAEAAASLAIPYLVQQVLDFGMPELADGDGSSLTRLLLLMGVAVVVQTVGRVAFIRGSGVVGNNILLSLRRRLYEQFQRLSIGFHDRYTSGRAVSRMTSDIEAVQELVMQGLDVVVASGLTIVGATVLLLYLDWRLALVAFLTYPLIFWLLHWFTRASTRGFRAVRTKSATTIVQFIETMTGIKAVQAFRREQRSRSQFRQVAGEYRDANIDVMRVFARAMPGIQYIGHIGTVVVVLVGGLMVLRGDLMVGVMAAFVLYLRMFFDPMQDIGQFVSSLQSALTALEKISSVMEERPEVADPERPVPLPVARGELRFDHVRFGYIDETVVLPDLTLHIPAGQTVALVGTTGAGKTTIAKLVARFYDPQEGAVTLDGVDLRDLDAPTLRGHVTLLTQENFIFAGTIAENIAFGRPDASREEIEAAAAAVGADVFIGEMPDGFDTDTGKRGSRLSAGQRQLVAFARVVLADPAVLILDEATSSLDIPSERLVQNALNTILADRTAIIIAHRLSTVAIADRVLVLQHGRVVEDGAPSELIGGEGRYADLHRAWLASLA